MILIAWVLAGLAVAGFFLWSADAFVRASPRAIVGAMKLFSASFVGLAGMGFLAFGRLGLIAALLGSVLLTVGRLRASRRPPDPIDGDASMGGQSAVDTAWLSMRLDRATGAMEGVVRKGKFSGRSLSSLEISELLHLRDELESAEPASLPLIETWLDRIDPDWRSFGDTTGQRGSSATNNSGGMDEATALDILGLHPGAERAEIELAYRRVMAQVHPDKGGSNRLASLVNAARSFLLGRA